MSKGNHIKNNNYVLLSLVFIFLVGCTTMMSYEEIVQSAKTTNVSDGVDRHEAIVLAQNYLIENGLDARHDIYRVGLVMDEGDHWSVQFNSGVSRGASQTRRFGFAEPISVKVDSTTGKVQLLR